MRKTSPVLLPPPHSTGYARRAPFAGGVVGWWSGDKTQVKRGGGGGVEHRCGPIIHWSCSSSASGHCSGPSVYRMVAMGDVLGTCLFGGWMALASWSSRISLWWWDWLNLKFGAWLLCGGRSLVGKDWFGLNLRLGPPQVYIHKSGMVFFSLVILLKCIFVMNSLVFVGGIIEIDKVVFVHFVESQLLKIN